jgi:hypothetical protein
VCLGTLPGVLFACCSHGGMRGGGYIYFENGVIVRFDKLTGNERASDEGIREARQMKAWQE